MKYKSTRHQALPILASEALISGIASDKGLYIPEKFPDIEVKSFIQYKSLPEFAAALLHPFFDEDPIQSHLPQICQNAFSFPALLRHNSKGTYFLELFHGPTAAFKDFGARFLAECLQHIPELKKKKNIVLVATSGDTGGAVAGAFYKKSNFFPLILYPKNRISSRQQLQLTAWGENVAALAVQGSFDDCQSLVKAVLSNKESLQDLNFLSANSINIGRLLPQMVYFAYTSLQYQKENGKNLSFIVPSGNLGHGVAAIWARHLGFPIEKICLATNANKAIPNFLETGTWKSHETVGTLANAMDVGSPSNIERLQNLIPHIRQANFLSSLSVSDQEIQESILSVFKNEHEVVCPHTATAVFAKAKLPHANWVIVATAHPAKFESIVEPLIGQSIVLPSSLENLIKSEPTFFEINKDLNSVIEFIRKNYL